MCYVASIFFFFFRVGREKVARSDDLTPFEFLCVRRKKEGEK